MKSDNKKLIDIKPIVFMGSSGTGKSSALFPNPKIGIKGLNPKETVMFQGEFKDLTYPGWRKDYKRGRLSEGANLTFVSSYSLLSAGMEYVINSRPEVKNIVIDDSQYIMARPVMENPKGVSWDEYKEIASNNYNSLGTLKVREGMNVIILTHTEIKDDGKIKIKTIGNMTDKYLSLDGIYTYILLFEVIEDALGNLIHRVKTHDGAKTTAKSPAGCFPDYIPNDSAYILDRIHKYEYEGLCWDDDPNHPKFNL